MTRRPITVRIARWSATHPWLAIGVWTLFVVLCVGASTLGFQAAKPDQFGQGESGRAAKVLSSAGLTPPATENVLITSKSGNLDDATAEQAAEDVAKAMRGLPEVVDVAAPVPAENGKALVVQVTMAGDPGTADQRVTPLLNQTAAVADRFPGLRLEETGAASVQSGINDKLGQDLTKAETLSLPITLLIMMIAFGAIIAAGVPVLLAISSVGSALGLWALVSNLVPDPGQVPHMILLMGMAVGVDYSLFYLKRERQERAQGNGRIDAIEIAAATSGHAVVVSGIAVIVSMAALFLTNDLIFTSLAAGSILVVVVAVVGSLTQNVEMAGAATVESSRAKMLPVKTPSMPVST